MATWRGFVEFRMWKQAKELVEEIYLNIPDYGNGNSSTYFRRVVLVIVTNLLESQETSSLDEYCAKLEKARYASLELYHMLYSAPFYRYMDGNLNARLDYTCREVGRFIKAAIEQVEKDNSKLPIRKKKRKK